MICLVYILGLCVGIIASDIYAGEKEKKQVRAALGQQKKEGSMSPEEWNVVTSAVQKEVERVTTPNVNLQPAASKSPNLPSSDKLYHD